MDTPNYEKYMVQASRTACGILGKTCSKIKIDDECNSCPMKNRTSPYTHRDAEGMLWRFDGERPISLLADEVMKNAHEGKL